jgi:hypothetical protein
MYSNNILDEPKAVGKETTKETGKETNNVTVTLTELINFTHNLNPRYKEEREFHNLDKSVLFDYLKQSKESWANGKYYLGGQIQMGLDEPITLDKIREVRMIRIQRDRDYGEPVNSAEAGSIYRSEIQLNQIETIIKKYIDLDNIRTESLLLQARRACLIHYLM